MDPKRSHPSNFALQNCWKERTHPCNRFSKKNSNKTSQKSTLVGSHLFFLNFKYSSLNGQKRENKNRKELFK